MFKQISMAEAITRIHNGEIVHAFREDPADWTKTEAIVLNDYLANIIPMAHAVKAVNDTPPKLPKVDTGKLYALKDAGWGIREIADELKVTTTTIRNYLRKRDETEGGTDDDQEETA